MDNLTHSLVGVTLAELASNASDTAARRRLVMAAGIVAANLPDADLFYARISPPPLGYLLQHRGHTHTVVGLAGQGLLLALACLVPAVRRHAAAAPRRFALLVAAALASHLVLDAWNSYGVHPFWPVDPRWFYGDAVNIFEPWLWLVLGVAAAANARRRLTTFVLATLLLLLAVLLPMLRMVPPGAAVTLVAVGVAGAWLGRGLTPRVRSAAALAVVVFFVLAMFAAKRVARMELLASLPQPTRAALVDLVLSPDAAVPICWSAIAIVRDEPAAVYVMRRGAASLAPGLVPPSRCGRRGLEVRTAGGDGTGGAAVRWGPELRQSLPDLRALAARDCWVRAWLRFGRAPVVRDDAIDDLRFTGGGSGSFAAMRLLPPAEASRCPRAVPDWGMPRADLLAP